MVDWGPIESFDWDAGDDRRSADKHAVTQAEPSGRSSMPHCRSLEDRTGGLDEPHWHALGHTDDGRRLHLTFTLRGQGTWARVISARGQSRHERTG
jgi:uncharacterized DUF497 family protein